MEKLFLTNRDCRIAAELMAARIGKEWPRAFHVYGVPRGGIPVAYLLSGDFTSRPRLVLANHPDEADIIVDDIVDSGKTRDRYRAHYPDKPFLDLVSFLEVNRQPGQWVVFPWEQGEQGEDSSADDIVVRLLQYVGEDPNRPGLVDTPRRVLKAWKEMTVGYGQNPEEILGRQFPSNYDELITSTWIPFISVCEHHLLPFHGVAHVGYIPSEAVHEGHGSVVGLSKLSRLVHCFANRLQIQEEMTKQIAEAINTVLRPRGVGVVIQAKHMCMACRGVKDSNSVMGTNVMLGALRTNPAARQEFLEMIKMARSF